MREKKYAHILDEENNKKTIENANEITNSEVDLNKQAEDLEDKLFKTREIMYKELQEVIDSEDDSPTQEIIIEDHKDKEKIVDLQETEDFKEELKEDLEKTITDDIYITKSFKPLKVRGKIKKIFKPIIILTFICAIFGLIGYFFVYPLLLKYRVLKPDNIFEKSVNSIEEHINNLLSTYEVDFDNYLLNINFDIETEMEDSKFLNDYNYNVLLGQNNNEVTKKFEVVGDDKDLSISLLKKDKNIYIDYSSSDEILKKEEENTLSSVTSISLLDIKKYFSIYIESLKTVIDDDQVLSESDEITINQKSLKVTRYSLKLDKNKNISFYQKYNELIANNEILIKIGAYLEGYSFEDYKQHLKDMIVEDSYDHEFLKIYNIYLVDGNKFVGFDIEEDGFRNYYYYNYKDDFEIYLNLSNKMCAEDCDDDRKVINVNGAKANSTINANVLYNSKLFLELKVNKIDMENIDLDYSFNYRNVTYNGSVNIAKKDNYIIDFTCDNGKFKINADGVFYKEYSSYNLEKEIIPYSEKKNNSRYNNYIEKLKSLGFTNELINFLNKYLEI